MEAPKYNRRKALNCRDCGATKTSAELAHKDYGARCRICHSKMTKFYHARWCAKNPGAFALAKKRSEAKRRLKEPDYRKNRDLKKMYGITIQQYRAMAFAQGGRCAICGIEHPNLHVDHAHVPGYDDLPTSERSKHVRCLLCENCNKAIGMLQENEAIMVSALEYVKFYRGRSGN